MDHRENGQGNRQHGDFDTHAPLYRGMQNGSNAVEADDHITFGGTVVVHERSHRDSPTEAQRLSEPRAYAEQYRVLQKFGPQAFKSRDFFYNKIQGLGARTQR
jgi:hypothetical protein